MVDAPTRSNDKGSPIRLTDIYDVAKEFDPATQRPALTTKLNRMKKPKSVEENGLLGWKTPKSVTTTPLGLDYRNEMALFLTHEDKARLTAAYKSAWGIDVSF